MSPAQVLSLWTPDAGDLAEQADEVLSPEEARRARAFRRDSNRTRYVVSHVWLRRILGDLLDVPPARVSIEPGRCRHCGGPHGKPQLPASTGWHFSLAHSGAVAMCAVMSSPVGVDVEAIGADSGYLELLPTLEPRERAALLATPRQQRAAAFTHCWVRKEAYLKGTGEGLSRGPHSVHVGLGGRFDDPEPSIDALDGWRLLDVDAPAGYAAALAVRSAVDDSLAPVFSAPQSAGDADEPCALGELRGWASAS
ncbi:MAG TPA: 4'-phosphopantetheinyl transferase superfamily protein [Solirubrobacteraceae bacterium]|jgi:4'-phosphopantetheinyl transferase